MGIGFKGNHSPKETISDKPHVAVQAVFQLGIIAKSVCLAGPLMIIQRICLVMQFPSCLKTYGVS